MTHDEARFFVAGCGAAMMIGGLIVAMRETEVSMKAACAKLSFAGLLLLFVAAIH